MSSDLINSSKFMASAVYSMDELIWCVSQETAKPQWMNLFYWIRDIETWIFGVILFLTAVIGVFVLTAFEKKPLNFWASVLLSVQTGIGYATTFKPKGLLLKSMHVLFLFIALLITTTFNAFTINLLKYKFYFHRVNSMEEITRENFNLTGIASAQKHLTAEKFHFSQKQLQNYHICNEIDKCLHELEFNKKLAVAVTRQQIMASTIQNSIYCFDSIESIFSYSTVFLLRTNLPFAFEFNLILNRLTAAGIIAKWQQDFQFKQQENIEIEYEYANFGGIFLLFGLALISCVGVAIFEQIVYRKSNNTRAYRFWKLFDKIIDDNRYIFILNGEHMSYLNLFRKTK